MAFPVREHNNKNERIGRMRHQVRFITPTTFKDGLGGEVHTWVTGDDVFATVEYRKIGSQDEYIADRYTNVLQALVNTRYNATIEPYYRLLYDSKEWEIQSILPHSHKMYMQLEVTQYEGGSDGEGTGAIPFGAGFFREEFPLHASDTIVVTENNGNLPTSAAYISLYFDNGQLISPNYWSHSGDTITLTFTPPGTQSIWVEFAYHA